MNRRTLLRSAALALPAIALAGCAGSAGWPGVVSAVPQIESDAKLVEAGLKALLPEVTALAPSLVAQINAYIADVSTAVTDLGTEITTAGAQPSVQSIEAAVNGAVGLLAAVPLPPPYSTYLQAAAALLPVMEAAVGMFVKSSAAAGAMSATEARTILSALPH